MTLKTPDLVKCDHRLRERLQTPAPARTPEQLRDLLRLIDTVGIERADLVMSIGTVNLRVRLPVAAAIHEDEPLLVAIGARGARIHDEDVVDLSKAFMEAVLGLRIQRKELKRDGSQAVLERSMARQQDDIEAQMVHALGALGRQGALPLEADIDFDRTVAWKRFSYKGPLELGLEKASPQGMARLREALLEQATAAGAGKPAGLLRL